MTSNRPERRARRLLSLYPRAWRRRFGDEFEQLLIDDLSERPRSLSRTADVAAHALLAHLTAAGLAGREHSAPVQAWKASRILGVVGAIFLAFAVSIWSGVSIGSSWAAPTAAGTRVATAVMSGALLGLCGVLVLAAGVTLWSIGRSIRVAPARQPGWMGVVAVCGVGLWLGCARVAAQWPGATPGLGPRGSVPVAVARAGWAATVWISAYWTHPAALAAQPRGVFVWMLVCPVLTVVGVVAALRAVGGVRPSRASLRALSALGVAGVIFAGVFVAGAAAWIFGAGRGPDEIFRPGSLDELGLVLLAGALLAAAHVLRRSLISASPSFTP